jgi:hypothetical protein
MRYATTLLAMVILPALAHAHAIGVDWKLRADKIDIEAFYDDDAPAVKAKVQLVNARDEVVAHAVTDEKGRCSFDVPTPGKYEVRVDAGAGHRAKKAIDISNGPPAPNADDAVPSVNSSRAEFTAFPWLKVLIGLLAIAGLSGSMMIAMMIRKPRKAEAI